LRARLSGKALVVDDEPELVEIAKAYLEEIGYTVYEAKDGTSALEAVAKHSDIDLIFTDLSMPPGINGFELVHRVRELLPLVAVIYCSGFPEGAMRVAGMPAVDGPLVRKPYRLADIEAAIRMVLE
jgi:CheY-like chemotaxis protein